MGNNKYRNRINFNQLNTKRENNNVTNINKMDINKINISNKKIEEVNDVFNKVESNNKVNPWKYASILLVVLFLISGLGFFTQKNTVKASKNANIELKNNVEPEKKKEQYLFLGDSIFEQYNVVEFFKGYDVINSGVGGATTTQVLENLDTRVFKYNPTTIFLLIGTNDLSIEVKEEKVAENIKEIVEKIKEKLPDVKINILSIFPINNTNNEKIINKYFETKSNENINKTNDLIKEYCKENDIEYIDMTKVLKDDEENLRLSYTIEGLHITDLGYHFITNELLKYMSKN